jgi:S-adenosylmethionine hydrolase
MRIIRFLVVLCWLCTGVITGMAQRKALVFQTDFGLKDGAVAAMKGVAFGVSPALPMFDLTHEIPPYNVWEAACRLEQTAPYWPAGTVFVSVVDPGVGSERKSVVLKTRTGHYFVTPDNGTLTLVARTMGIAEVREIDEARNRRHDSDSSYTFHGRDVYAYIGARLAAGVIAFSGVGHALPAEVVRIPYQEAVFEQGLVKGNIPILDVQYGNIWTNINAAVFNRLGLRHGDKLKVQISHEGRIVYEDVMPYAATFSAVPLKQPLCYLNSLMNVAFALNQDSFAAIHKIGSGPGWSVTLRRP